MDTDSCVLGHILYVDTDSFIVCTPLLEWIQQLNLTTFGENFRNFQPDLSGDVYRGLVTPAMAGIMNNNQLLYVPVVEFSTLGVFIMDYCLFQWGWMWGSFDSPTMLLRSREAAKQ